MQGHIRTRRGPQGTVHQLIVHVGRDDDGRRRSIFETFHGSKRDAQTRLAQLVADVSAGRVGVARAATVDELTEAWWDAYAVDLSPSTRIGYRGVLDRHILPTFGRKRIDKVKPADVDRWYGALLKGTAPTSRGLLAPRSIRNVHNLLSGLFAAAVRWGWLAASPIDRTRPPRPPAWTVERAPQPEEIARALAAAEQTDPELFVFLRFAGATGTRRGETCALRWSDFDLDAGDVWIGRAVAHDDTRRGQLVEKDTKTHQSARIALDPDTIAVLRAHRTRMIERALACGTVPADDSFVFSPEIDGSSPWNPDVFTQRWTRLRARIGLDHVRLHDFRHYHGTELAEAGVPLTTVSKRLRHSNLRTTSIYVHGRHAGDQRAAEAIGRALPPLRGAAVGDDAGFRG